MKAEKAIGGWHWLSLYVLYLSNAHGAWPSTGDSTVYLLGVFEDAGNATATIEPFVHSRAMFQAAVLLSQRANITVNGQYIGWQSVQAGGGGIRTLRDTCIAVFTSNIVGVIGPELSREVQQIAGLAQTIGLPVISHAATSPDLSDRSAYPTFYRTVPSDTVAAVAMAKLFLRYNWTSCTIIYQNDAFGSGAMELFGDTFADYGLTVADTIIFDVSTLKIRGNLKDALIQSPTRIVVLWTLAVYTSMIIQSALDQDVLGPRFTWILSASIPLTSFNKTLQDKLVGMLALEPIAGNRIDVPTNTALLTAAHALWNQYEPHTVPTLSNINPYGLFAFDATWALIQSLQNVCSTAGNNISRCLALTNSSNCFDRRLTSSSALLEQINSIAFLGVSGPVQFDRNSTDRINGSYYYAQNVQYSSDGAVNFVPVLSYAYANDWRVYSRTNVIVWPGNTFTPPSGLAKPIGVTLRIAVIESTPFTIITHIIDSSGRNITKLIGYVPDLIEELENRMGFIVDLQLAPPNLTYTAIVQLVANGTYDLLVGDVTVTSIRRDIVSFSNSIFDNALRIVLRKTSDPSVDLFSYLKPFSRSLWLLLLGAIVFASALICLIERKTNEALRDRSSLGSAAMSLWFSFGTVVGYGVDFHVGTAAGRLLTAGMYILSLVLVASYTANLASDLTIAKSEGLINGITDLKSGKVPFSRIGIRLGTASEDFYLREISGGSRNFYTLTSRNDLYQKLLDGSIDVAFLDSGVAEYITNNVYCNLTLLSGELDKGTFGIVAPKQWLYQRNLDVNVLALRESGKLDALRQKWFQSKMCPIDELTSTAMSLKSMSGLLLTFAVIAVLAVGVYLVKRCRVFGRCLRRLRRRRRYGVQSKDPTSHHVNLSVVSTIP